MMLEGKAGTCVFYMENSKMTVSANVDSLQNASIEQANKEVDELTFNFIKENPKSYYSLILISRMVKGMSADKIDRYIKILDPKKEAVVKKFKTDLKASPTAITVDNNDNLYLASRT
ncbi:MAG TPA: hypothetical protein DEO33_02940 [Rikenellaceae bacterium]|jgi:hypothetical protein|nr:hypothetical protein [Rikenellaceae bacterium]